MTYFDTAFWIAVAAGTVRAAMPLLLAGLGELVYQRSGVMNLGLEGIMLLGAWATVTAQLHGFEWHLALVFGAAAGILGSLLHWLFSVKFRLNQPVVGLALLFFLQGTTAVWGRGSVGKPIQGIPLIGGIFGTSDPMVVLTPLIVFSVWYFLFQTRRGIILRACGESASSSFSAGVSVLRYRACAAIFAGASAGLAGGHFAIAYAQQWQENMISGRGWIALVLVIFSAWHPARLLFGALLFGGLTAVQINLQIRGLSSSRYLLGMLPFLITIGALIFASLRERSGKGRAPADLGKPLPE